MIKKLRVAVDHGNRNMKTCNFVFTTGLTEQDKKPARGEKYLKYQGKYYTLSEKRIPYQRDKTQDSRNRFWILTLFAIAMELEQKAQIQPENVIQVELPIGLHRSILQSFVRDMNAISNGTGRCRNCASTIKSITSVFRM